MDSRSLKRWICAAAAGTLAIAAFAGPLIAGYPFPEKRKYPRTLPQCEPNFGYHRTCWSRALSLESCDTGAGCATCGADNGPLTSALMSGGMAVPDQAVYQGDRTFSHDGSWGLAESRPISVLPSQSAGSGNSTGRYSGSMAVPGMPQAPTVNLPQPTQPLPAMPAPMTPGSSLPPAYPSPNSVPSGIPQIPGPPNMSTPPLTPVPSTDPLPSPVQSSRYSRPAAPAMTSVPACDMRTPAANGPGLMSPANGVAAAGSRYGATSPQRPASQPPMGPVNGQPGMRLVSGTAMQGQVAAGATQSGVQAPVSSMVGGRYGQRPMSTVPVSTPVSGMLTAPQAPVSVPGVTMPVQHPGVPVHPVSSGSGRYGR